MIFDSDVLIWYLRGDRMAARSIDAAPMRAISVVTLMEIMQGARSSREMKDFRKTIVQLGFRVLPLSEAIGHTAAVLIEEHALTHGLQVQDALVAATALENGESLATGNARHFRVISRLELKRFKPSRN